MDSYPYGAPPPTEQLWREEVLYLHSLWHKGPPRNPNPQPNSNNLGASNSPTPKPNSENLGASNPTTFKKRKKKQRGAKKKKDPKPIVPEPCQETGWPESSPQSDQATGDPKLIVSEVDLPCGSDREPCQETGWPKSSPQSDQATEDPKPVVTKVELPCGSDPEPCQGTGGWPKSSFQSDQATGPATAEEQAKSTALYMQQKGLKACQDFFSSRVCSDDNEEEELMDDGINESEEFKFFMGIFTGDSYLRDYYEKNWESGEFCCLVCGGIGKKLSKKFKNCVALVQHSTAISKTKRKAAHRAFGKAICQILGLEIYQHPSIVLPLDSVGTKGRNPVSTDGPLGHTRSTVKAEFEVGLNQCSARKEELHENFVDLVDDSDGEVDPKDHGISFQKEYLQGKVVDYVIVDMDEQMDIQVCSNRDDGLNQKNLFIEDTVEKRWDSMKGKRRI